jgi:ribosome assembly protein YihI (activator of Der GTPase)
MLDLDNGPRRGRRRLYCSDTCRRDASAARTAAQRYGSPIRVVEVPKTVAPSKPTAESTRPEPVPIEPLDAVGIMLENDDALNALLARVTEQARLKKLDRTTLTAARELAKAVHPLRSW